MFGRCNTINRIALSRLRIRKYAQQDRECTPRPDNFYEEENIKRNYYYVMDLRGQLFVENVVRSVATSMKDAKFLDFMFKNLQWNNTGINADIPFVTYCGKEKNFVTPMDANSAFVFKDMIVPKMCCIPYQLYYAGTSAQEFDPALLAFSPATGRMYHQILGHKHLSTPSSVVYGLLHVNITSQCLSHRLVFEKDDKGDDVMSLMWENWSRNDELCKYPVRILK